MALVSASMISCQEPEQAKSQQEEIAWQGKEIMSASAVVYEADEYNEPTANKDLVNLIFDELIYQEGVKITDWDGTPLTLKYLEDNVLSSVRNIHVEVPDEPGSFTEVNDTLRIESRDVIEILTIEEWDFNRSKMSLQKRINKLGVVVNSFDMDGNKKGKRLLFYIELNS